MTHVQVKLIAPDTFHFAEPGAPCAYWSLGAHIVQDGVCRCGKKFMLTEVIGTKEVANVG